MNRIQFVELLDFDWVPRSLRTAAMAYLRFTLKVSGHADALAPKVKEALETSGQRRIVDLCSGGSGPWAVGHDRPWPAEKRCARSRDAV